MTTGRDEDALSWDGDDDPTLDVGTSAATTSAEASAPATTIDAPVESDPPVLPEGFHAVGKGSEEIAHADDPPQAAPATAPIGNAALITLGVLGGAYLLYAIGWIIGGLRLQGRSPSFVGDFMFQGSLWLAVAAPLIWFATTFLLTRDSKGWVRLVWLFAGALLLVPWPFVMVGAVGA